MCEELSLDIGGDESIIRFILSPVHVRPGKSVLKKSVFKPRAGTDLVSVARLEFLGANVCKAKAKEVPGTKAQYIGLARILAADIRGAGSEVVDAREGYYVGHGHLLHGFVVPEGDPPDARLIKRLDDICEALLSKTRYFPDPDTAADVWTGDCLKDA